MSDDPGNFAGAQPQITGPIMSADPNVALAQGLGYYDTGAATSPVVAPYMQKLQQGIASGQIAAGQPIGPGGADPKTGLPYSWIPYDPSQQIFDPHQHFGPTYNDPILGQLQSMYTEPSKSANDLDRIGQALFGIGLSAITAGAGSPLVGTLFNSAMQLGNGTFNPLNAAISAGTGAISGIPGVAPILNAASSAYQASHGNFVPGAISLAKLAGGP